MKTLRLLALCSAALSLTPLQSQAQDMLLLDQYPGSLGPPADLAVVNSTASYNPGTGMFYMTADPGDQITYTDAALNQSYLDPGSFTVSAIINSSGHLSSGSIAVSGTIHGIDPDVLLGTLQAGPPGSPPGTALVGSAYDYATSVGAYEDGGDLSIIYFTFTVTGGVLAADFGGVGAQAIISFCSNQEITPIGDWTTSWSNEGYGTCDVFPIPEPSSTLLFLMGGAAWSVARRCRRSLFRSAV